MNAKVIEKNRYQIALNLSALEFRQLAESAEHQGLRPGTLVNSLWETVFPLLRQVQFSVWKFKENLSHDQKLSNNDRTETAPPQSKLDLWALDFLHHLEAGDDLEDLLQLADRKRYKRPDVHVTSNTTHATGATKKAFQDGTLKQPLAIEVIVDSFTHLDADAQLRFSAELVDEVLQAGKYRDAHVIMFDRRKYAREVPSEDVFDSVINH